MSLQACVDSLTKQDAAKVHGALLPLVGKAANDPAPEVREANMEVLVSFALKAGNLGLLEKVNPSSHATYVGKVGGGREVYG